MSRKNPGPTCGWKINDQQGHWSLVRHHGMKNTVALMRHGSQRLTGKNTAGSSALTLPTKCTLIVVLWLRSAQMSPEDRAVLFLKITSKKSICTVDGTSRRSAPPSRSVEMKTTAGPFGTLSGTVQVCALASHGILPNEPAPVECVGPNCCLSHQDTCRSHQLPGTPSSYQLRL